MNTSYYLLLSIAYVSLTAQNEKGPLPSVDYLVSGFRANRDSFPTLHILWTRKHELADASLKLWEIQAEKYGKESNDASKTARERAMALQLYENAKKFLANPILRKPSIIIQEFRTDRKSYQYRRFNASDLSDLPIGYSFSKRSPADSLNLQTIFANTRISAYDHATATYKFWFGRRDGRDYYRGEIRRSRLGDSEAFIPPLGLDSDAHGGILNEIDTFFALPKAQMSVIRAETKGGVETYVIEHLQELKLAPDFLIKELPRGLIARFPGKLQLFAITTAWVDAKRGCIPLRVEKTGAFFYEGRRLGPVPQLANSLTVFKVQKVDRGGWYPMKGRVYSYNQDPEWTKGQNSMELLLTDRFYDIPHVIVNSTSWDTQNIETVSDIADFFRLDFPNDTEYFDEQSKKFLFIGDQETYREKVLRHENPQHR
jgi:hypothetical protein